MSPSAYTELGLSPQVRGNLEPQCDRVPSRGSVPARAGEPASCLQTRSSARVYPRACGGTRIRYFRAKFHKGLSPHVRGNRSAHGTAASNLGSIPARAGEPQKAIEPRPFDRVYPRTYGGTVPFAVATAPVAGLSPHVRGNLLAGRPARSNLGSIPARTGEPRQGTCSPRMSGVYPRTYGGTVPVPVFPLLSPGLSPHVRGNRMPAHRVRTRLGSIPARTGEPSTIRVCSAEYWVYPRTYGGTILHGNAMLYM